MGVLKKIGNVAKKVVNKTIIEPTNNVVNATLKGATAVGKTAVAGAQAISGNKEKAKITIKSAGSDFKTSVLDSVQADNAKTIAKVIKKNPQAAQTTGKILTAVGGAVATTGVGAVVGGAISGVGVGLTYAGKVAEKANQVEQIAESAKNKDVVGVAGGVSNLSSSAQNNKNMGILKKIATGASKVEKTANDVQTTASAINSAVSAIKGAQQTIGVGQPYLTGTTSSLSPKKSVQVVSDTNQQLANAKNAVAEMSTNSKPLNNNSMQNLISKVTDFVKKPIGLVVVAVVAVAGFFFFKNRKSAFRR